MIEHLPLIVSIGAGLVAASILTSLISFRAGAPLLLIFLCVGLLAGEDGPGGILFTDAPIAFLVGNIALAVILFDSGFATSIQAYRQAAAPALALATLGVVLTAMLVALPATLIFGFPILIALLIGVIVGSTDAAAVFFLLRTGGIAIRERTRSILEIESGTNDPVAVFLTTATIELIRYGRPLADLDWRFAGEFGLQMGIGAAIGIAAGFGIVEAANRIRLESALAPLLVLSLALATFGITGLMGGSGFLAVYAAGLVAGNRRLGISVELRKFQAGVTWLAQICMFLVLGLLATPSQFTEVAPVALVLGIILIFVARPLAVWICLAPFGIERRETAFVAWVGLRGAVSILLGILPAVAGIPNGILIFDIVFMIVVISLLLQGWTVKPMARRLGLIVPPRIGPVERIELALPGGDDTELVAYRVAPGSLALRGDGLPRWARPSLIERAGRALAPDQAGVLEQGDRIYLFANPDQIRLLDKFFSGAVGAQDQDFYGDFDINPGARMAEIGATYGFPVAAEIADLDVATLFDRAFAGRTETGDRQRIGPMELIVRSTTPEGRVAEAGLSVDPPPAAPSKVGLFSPLRDIRAWWRGRN